MGETIELKAADGFSFSAYTAGPANATKGVVVVQDIFGVNHHIRDMADRFAAAGYAVVAPAVYDRVERGFEVGYTPDDIAKGRDVRMKLNDADLMKVSRPPLPIYPASRWHRRLPLWRTWRGGTPPVGVSASSCWKATAPGSKQTRTARAAASARRMPRSR